MIIFAQCYGLCILGTHRTNRIKKQKIDKIMSKKEKETPILADEALGKSEAFVLNNRKTITGVVLAVVLLVVAYLGYTKFILEPQNDEANKAMVVAVQNFEAGNHAESLDGDGINMGTRAIADEYGNTKAGNLAKAYAGLSLAKQENYEEAIQYLEDFDGDDAIVAQKVKHALGNCYAHTGDTDKAISLILDAANSANNEAVTPFCLRDVAAMYEQQGKTAEAVELYERIKKEYPSCVLVLTGEIDRQLNSAK